MGYRRRCHHRCRRLAVALTALVAALTIVGCSLRGPSHPETYTVRRGDTLYSIAATYGLDWHELAQWNRIGPPYRIDVGQQLTLERYPSLDYAGMNKRGATPPHDRRRPPRVARAPQDSRAAQQRAIQASTPRLNRTIEREPPVLRDDQGAAAAKQSATQPSRAPASGPVADEAEINQASKQTPAEPTRTGGPSEDGWQWPASGSILRGYGARRTRQGIDIGGQEGAPIYAASSGRVVYNGTGLKGYGQLVIIQHDEHYLSAYGFTQRTLIEQGRDVAAGTHIADMGLGPQNTPMLHFEIRRDGEPIDPASVLPSH